MLFNVKYKVGRKSFKTTISGEECQNNEFLAGMIAQAHLYDFGANISRDQVSKVEVNQAKGAHPTNKA